MDSESLRQKIDDWYCNHLNIAGFIQMIHNPTFCYKFYWLEALVNLIVEEKEPISFNSVTDEMILNAWYSVVEFHIHLSGYVKDEVRDALERAVLKLREISGLSGRASRPEIENALQACGTLLDEDKKQLVKMVPYRALSGFFNGQKCDRQVPWGATKKLIEFVNRWNATKEHLPYTFGEGTNLDREVIIDRGWAMMIRDYAGVILAWIQFHKLRWLQNINLDVPGLVYKLTLPDEPGMRKLEKVRKLWDAILERCEVQDVFKGAPVDKCILPTENISGWISRSLINWYATQLGTFL